LVEPAPFVFQKRKSMIDNTIDLTPLMGPVLELVAAAVTGVVGVALRRWLGLKADNEVRGYLDSALNRAVLYGLNKAKDEFGQLDKVTVRNAVLDAAARYAVEAVPDALRRFRITPQKVRDLVEARMP
jgi:hypothetical protein